MIDLTGLSPSELGWCDFFEQQRLLYPDYQAARVIRQDLNRYHLIMPGLNLIGTLPGKTRATTFKKSELPAVGDWVMVSKEPTSSNQVLIHKTLERQTKFSRKESGERFGEQIIAANIDLVFIVTGLDDNFSASRIERYLLLTWQSGASPIILLNKADLCNDLEEKLSQVQEIAKDTPIHCVSAITKQGLDELDTYIRAGITIAVLGSSGVGKSTLINQLLGYEHFATGAVRELDSKGRHTTTHRELCAIEGGGMIIDTPGMREIQFWAEKKALNQSFDDVDSLAAQCKFNDCAHVSEPHCAIRLALAEGRLSQERYTSFQRFHSELSSFQEKMSASLRARDKPPPKKITKARKKQPTRDD